MEGLKLVNIAVIAALVEQSACNTIKPVHVEPTPLISPPTEVVPTMSVPTPTEIPPTRMPEKPFFFGELDMRVTPFKLDAPPELEAFLGYTDEDALPETHADTALPFGAEDFGSEKQLELQKKQNEEFDKARYHHPLNPYYLILSDIPNLLFFTFHSLQESAPGDMARVLGGFVYRNKEDPQKLGELYKQKFILTFEGKAPISAEIVNVTTVSKEFYDDLTESGPWGIDEETDSLIGLTDSFKISRSIRDYETPGVYYMTIIGCQSEIPGKPSLLYSQNIVNRTLLTLRITIFK